MSPDNLYIQFRSFIGALSRAIGNDLVEADFTELTFRLWPPVVNTPFIKKLAREYAPGAELKIDRKSGRALIVRPQKDHT